LSQTLKLRDLLAFLERKDVSEVLLQTDSPPCVMLSGQVRPLSKTPLAEEAIYALLKGTSAIEPAKNASCEEVTAALFELEGKAYRVSSFIRKGRLQLRFVPAEASRPAVAAQEAEHVEKSGAASAGPTTAQTADRAIPGDRLLSELLMSARKRRASDVHISSGRPTMVRAAGELLTAGDPIAHEQVEALLLPLLNASRREQLDRSGYADLATNIEGAGRVRININRQRDGLKGCFRLTAPYPLPLAELGLPPELSSITKYHQGLVVISGPNGSGKSTTLASLVDVFNATRPVHIITVEDPVEVLHPCKKAVVSQREVGSHTRSFAAALKGALREDPDVIAIGELRDLETVEMALSAAETGHLVIATMSTPSGARTIDRLIDMFPPGVQNQVRATLAGTLKMVISQRLIPNADKTKRHAAAEMITGNIPLWAMIRDNKLYQLPSLLQRGRAYGMIRIDDSLNDLVAQGLVTAETARLYADDPKSVGIKAEQTADASPHAPPPADAQKKQPGKGGLFGKRGK
jgi:twitching motility protein PilT